VGGIVGETGTNEMTNKGNVNVRPSENNPPIIRRYVNVGFRLNDHADLVPDPNEMQIEYSVDPWMAPPTGYVCFCDSDDREYFIPEGDITRPLAPWNDKPKI
jgi:hypothetical protein